MLVDVNLPRPMPKVRAGPFGALRWAEERPLPYDANPGRMEFQKGPLVGPAATT
jgi:hypothetical protein